MNAHRSTLNSQPATQSEPPCVGSYLHRIPGQPENGNRHSQGLREQGNWSGTISSLFVLNNQHISVLLFVLGLAVLCGCSSTGRSRGDEAQIKTPSPQPSPPRGEREYSEPPYVGSYGIGFGKPYEAAPVPDHETALFGFSAHEDGSIGLTFRTNIDKGAWWVRCEVEYRDWGAPFWAAVDARQVDGPTPIIIRVRHQDYSIPRCRIRVQPLAAHEFEEAAYWNNSTPQPYDPYAN